MRVLVIFIFGAASAMQTTTFVKRAEMSDLQSSATGYSYQSGQPFSYVHFRTQPLQQPLVQPTLQPIIQPINYLKYPNVPIPIPIPYQQPVKLDNNLELQGEEGEEAKASYEKGDGSQYNSEEQSSKGEKGEKGYASKHGYEKGEKGHYGKEGEKGYYAENGGNKKAHNDEAQHYGSHHAQGVATNGGTFSESNSHKKGHKTTGFHKIYHKDEYNKDHSFYDESDKRGHFSKYGSGHAAQGAVKGGYQKGGNSEAGYQNNDYGKKGFHDRGRYEKGDQGQRQAEGNDKYHSSHSQFANKQGKEGGKEYGYSLE